VWRGNTLFGADLKGLARLLQGERGKRHRLPAGGSLSTARWNSQMHKIVAAEKERTRGR